MENTRVDEDCSQIATMEYEKVPEKYEKLLEDIFDSLNIHIVRKEWRSRYNSYVVYDYKPFCADGFDIYYICQAKNFQTLNFATFVYNKKTDVIEALENGQYIGRELEGSEKEPVSV